MDIDLHLFDVYPFTFWWLTQRPISAPASMPFHMQVAGSYDVYFLDLQIQHSEKMALYTSSIVSSIQSNTWTVAAPAYQAKYSSNWWDAYYKFNIQDIPNIPANIIALQGPHLLFGPNTMF